MPIVGHRPITLQRFPTGIDGEEFFAKNPPRGVPEYAQTVTLTYPSGRKHPQLVLNELAVAVGGSDEHHHPPSLAGVRDGEEGRHRQPRRAAHRPRPPARPRLPRRGRGRLALKEVLADLDLTAYAKTSGNRGVHVHARIEPTHEFLDVRHGVIAIARELERRLPDLVTTSWWKEERGEKVFVDFNQANRDRTIASAFSPRPLTGAPVSAVAWDDLTEVAPSDFTVRSVPPLGRERDGPVGVDARFGRHHRRSAGLVGARRGDGLPDQLPARLPEDAGGARAAVEEALRGLEYLPTRRVHAGQPGGATRRWDLPRRRRR